ncbi:MAG: isocitrate lyase [Myxococcales bacterium 68-20]|nr:isocitrate lyase ICL2 [Myxococcales bacterium]OJY17040.1 MAG: isocitrate lyase [Myxococcales bacterium 68-20]
MTTLDEQITAMRRWFDSPRFAGIRRLYTPREVVEQRGTIRDEYAVARDTAAAFHARLRELFVTRKCMTSFGPYSPGEAVAMKRTGIEGIYVGGWATSAKGSADEDPGPDLASYPLSRVPDEARSIVRALLTADRNEFHARLRMSEEQRKATPAVDYRPFIIADADTGHGGDAHVRNLIRRFVEAGVPGYHIEDQKPGVKKCGHQGGKVLVSEDEQIKRLSAARFQLDIMQVPGIIVARTDAESATLLDGRSDERDQPFILGATNPSVPSFKIAFLAILRALHRRGVEELTGYQIYATSDEELATADAWHARAGLTALFDDAVAVYDKSGRTAADAALDKVFDRFVDVWQAEANVKTYAEAVAEVIRFRAAEGVKLAMTEAEWLESMKTASFYQIGVKAKALGLTVVWDCEHAKTPDGYYQVRGGIDYAIAKSLAAAPYADVLWMETKTADLHDAKVFADAIHAKFPDRMLAYNLSPSFNWDSTGMTDEQMRRFPEELGKLGFVFNFITYGGHQIDGLAGEEFATALRQDGMLALARLQRKFRLLESPYRTPQTLVGGPRADAALMSLSGRTATTKAMGVGSTQFQHLIQTEVPPKTLEGWLDIWRKHHAIAKPFKVTLRPLSAGSQVLELAIAGDGTKAANVIFEPIQDRQGRNILSIRDQNTFDASLQKKRLMTLAQLFLIHRYKIDSLHYLTPTDDNKRQTEGMKRHEIFSAVNDEVGQIIVADVNKERVKTLAAADRAALTALITEK